jgi:hypothetical protein
MDMPSVVVNAYAVAFVCILIIEIARSARLARAASRIAIIAALVGSSTWSYAAYFAPHQHSASSRHASHRQSPGTAHGEWAADTGGGRGIEDDSDGKDGKPGSGDADDDDRDGAPTTSSAGPVEAFVQKAKIALGFEAKPDDDADKICLHCPKLIRVRSGESVIGAAETEVYATPAERPQQKVRVWPGFWISEHAISQADFNAFLRETGRAARGCAVAPPMREEPAVCLSYADAQAYASWLTVQSGRRFRLPTAVEWEYAVRRADQDEMRWGEVTELVADCWRETLPDPAAAELTVRADAVACQRHIAKGAAVSESPRWHRPSARRPIEMEALSRRVGFRVVMEQ